MNIYERALKEHGSERKAAKALGLSRSKFLGNLNALKGLCRGHICKNPPEKGKTRCRVCLDKCKSKKSKEEVREYNQAYYKANRRRILDQYKEYQKKNLDKFNKSRKKYDKTPKGKLSSAKRRARRLYFPDEAMSAKELKTLKKSMPACFNCQSVEDLTLDHHIPISKGGTLTQGNTVVLCRKCNSSKQDKSPEEFYTEKQLEELKAIFKSLL